MSGTEPGIAEIVAEVLAEHIWTPRKKGPAECWSADDDAHCGRKFTTGGEYRRHVAQIVAERLQAAEVGACGAAGGEVGGNVVRTRCDEDSGSYGTCGCPIRCNRDAGHEGEHRANRQGVLTGWRGRL